MDKYSVKKEPDEFGNGKFEAHLFNSSREELLLYYEKTNTQFFFSGLVIMFLNALLLFLILKLRRRKKYFIIILSACISLLLHGAGYLTASLQRYLMFHLSWLLTETWKCSFWPHLLLFDLGDKGLTVFHALLDSSAHVSKLRKIIIRQIGYFYLLSITFYSFGRFGHSLLYENLSNLCITYKLEEDAIDHMKDDTTDHMILA
ncbi:Glutamate racemase [Trichinella pseudospiralis]